MRLYVDFLGFYDTFFPDSCTVIDPKWRVDCGWPGISAEQCKRRGCCFDSSKPGTRFCFYKAGMFYKSKT